MSNAYNEHKICTYNWSIKCNRKQVLSKPNVGFAPTRGDKKAVRCRTLERSLNECPTVVCAVLLCVLIHPASERSA